MQQKRAIRPRYTYALAALIAIAALYRLDAVSRVAYAFEKGKLQADADHLSTIRDSDVAGLEQLSHAFSVVADAVKPSVVHINALTNDPKFNDQLRRMLPRGPFTPRPRTGTGSGVIIDNDGHIVTNNHVVDGAQRVNVELADGRHLHAKVIGTDPKTDIAVIQINADRLHPARFGDSDKMKVGYMVMAIGSPFRLDHTVSHGIISATERHGVVEDIEYEGFLQTDAPINPGNSGGPLINTRGEIVGINTAIATESGGNQGVGFSIPSNTVKHVAEMLKSGKGVIRGYLGVSIGPLSLDVAASYGLSQPAVLVRGVLKDGPAARGGLKVDDILTAINGHSVQSSEQLQRIVADIDPGNQAEVSILRDQKEKTLRITIDPQPVGFSTRGSLDEQSDPEATDDGSSKPSPEPQPITSGDGDVGSTFQELGFSAQTVSPKLSSEYQLNSSVQNGAVVTRVDPLSGAYDAGLRVGNVIVRVDGERINNIRELKQALNDKAVAKGVRVQIRMHDGTGYPLFLKAE